MEKNISDLFPSPEDFAQQIEEGRKYRMIALEDRRRSCLSRWYPKVKDIVPTPRTEILTTTVDLEQLWDNKTPDGFDDFISELSASANRIGLPVFLRSGCASGKHSWKKTCYLTDVSKLASHIYQIVEFSGMADLPTDVWVIREVLDAEQRFTAFYGEMPITTERRYFVRDGEVVCHHPYWPAEAIEGHKPSDDNWQAILAEINMESAVEVAELSHLTRLAGKAVEGFWSVDWLLTNKGWYLTGMGTGEQSYHWPECSV